jgi:hypothetical protein
MCVHVNIYSLISEVNTGDKQSDLVLLEGWASEEACQQMFKPDPVRWGMVFKEVQDL